jgi:hypothetical protein
MLNLRAAGGWVVNAKPRLLYTQEGALSHVADEVGWASFDRHGEIKKTLR